MKTIDQIYHCQMPGQVFGVWQLQCHLRIFLPHDEVQTVIITDMGFEMGWFIPYLVEKLANQIVREFCLDPAKLVWIEHYTLGFNKPTCADFSQVTFEWHNGQATNPQWTTIAPETVTALISEELLSA
ncbi:hypothetical protein H6G89_27570 [Oscillatoria sp. FACHB-1407]|uniref:hypothetical protein n=1 Tax=Oscillatoria sp. FACHB-1407 TaxID=2692847 RepID=UPI001686C4CE|nr:hypothetical protein [Oscillatoria sp. FACHB-1407]MBD2464765.1 hypothetical protein [Oscillatoria sp. FACHB-1407]